MTTSYDELIAAKKLLDRGTITQEEFDAKKAQLLAADAPTNDSTTEPTMPKEPQKNKTALIVGIAAAVVAVIVAAVFAVASLTSLGQDDHGDAIIGTWPGYFFTADGSTPTNLSSSTRVVVDADHTLTFGGGGIDLTTGTWKFVEEHDDGAIIYEVELGGSDPLMMLLQRSDDGDVLSINFSSELVVFFRR